MRILAIETSCDETAIALVHANGGLANPSFEVLKSALFSQITIHRPFGGVVPNIAKREHLRKLPILFGNLVGISNFSSKGGSSPGGQFPTRPNGHSSGRISNEIPKNQILKLKNFFKEVDLIAVTVGPGLEPALWTGIEFAKALGTRWNKPVAGVNHMEGHLYSFLLPKKQKRIISNSQFSISKPRTSNLAPQTSSLFPAIALLVSGGHTILLHMRDIKTWKMLGETRDDAVGEAFDKVARMLKLPYPGGPEIEKNAKLGNPQAIAFPRPMMNEKNYDFSFSGLKTSVLYYLKRAMVSGLGSSENTLHPEAYTPVPNSADVAASFQQAAVEVLTTKTIRAAKAYNAKMIVLAGGVAANKTLRKTLEKQTKKIGASFFAPDFKYNTDNAVMIAVAAYFRHLQKKKPYPLRANGGMNI